MSRSNRMKISGEVKINIFHRDNLRVTAACGTAFHTETGAKRGLTKANQRLPANPV